MTMRSTDTPASAGQTSTRIRRLAAVGGLVACWSLAGGAWAQGAAGSSDQDLQNRLLGKPSTAAAQSPPDCSTPQALESNPDCGQPVKGGERGFKLFDQGGKPTTSGHPAVAPAAGRRPAGGGTTSVKRPRGASGAAASCAMGDASNSRAVNLCVTFAMNSTALTSQSRESLDQLVKALNSSQISNRNVVIQGYADSSGAAAANLRLSDGRAHAVAEYLAAHGVARSRIDAKGLGATNFLAGHPPTDPANRRVEAQLKD